MVANTRAGAGNIGRGRGGNRVGAWPLALTLGLALVGCSQKDQKKCQQALDVARKSLAVKNVDLAQKWRVRAYTYCSDATALSKLDQDIVARRKAIETEKRQNEEKKTHAQELTALLVQWAGQHRAQPDGAATAVTCGPLDADAGAAAKKANGKKEKLPRWCTRIRNVSNHFRLAVRYREDDPKAVDFSTLAPAPVSCDALGTNKVMVKGPPKTYCQITGGNLQGMQALITNQPDGTHIDVFTPDYVQRDATIRRLTR